MAKEFSPAPEIEQIAEKLIELFRPEMLDWDVPIKYIFCSENPKKDGREVTGLAHKITGRNAYLMGYPDGLFCIETGLPAYEELTAEQKIAYVHHELCHFLIGDDGNLALKPHDIEEHTEVARVHGSYHDGLIIFAAALELGNSDEKSRKEMIAEILADL